MREVEILLLGLYGLCLAFMLGFSLTQWQLTRLARRASPRPLPPPPPVWPRVTVQLPLYNERYVVERLIQAAAALDYPRELLHIQVLDDSTDDTLALAAAQVAHFRAQGLRIDHVRRPRREGYKAGALAYGLTCTDGVFIAIFDADFVPGPDFLRLTIPHFTAARTGVVQTRWGHLNEKYSLLTELQAFGLNAHFLIEQVGRAQGRHFLNFNGTGGVWRRTCIDESGGWQADTLTEDLDLSYRAQLRGWQFVYLPQVQAPAELPATLDALKSQQYRWTKGAAETARKHLGRVLRAPLPVSTKLHALFHLLNSTVFVAIFIMGLLSVPVVYIRAYVPEFTPVFHLASVCILGFVPLTYFFYTAWRQEHPRAGLGEFGRRLGLFLALSMGLSLHNARAVLAGLAGQRTAFIRTPKLGLGRTPSTLRGPSYRTRSGRGLTVLEGLLTVYFLFGMGAGIYFGNYGLLPFHTLLALGYGLVCYYSLRSNQPAA